MKTTRNTSSQIFRIRRWQTGKSARFAPSGIVLFIVILFWTIGGRTSFGQGVGISETSIVPDGSSILELQSTLRGFLGPRMTETQRNAIVTPATGLIVYNTTTNKLNIFDGTFWRVLFSGNLGVNSITGTLDRISISGTSADPVIDIAANYIGQTSINTLGTITTGTWNANILNVQYGGTGLSSGNSGGIPYFSSSTTIASSALLTANGVVIGGGAGTAPLTIGVGAASTVLRGTGGAPSFGQIQNGDITDASIDLTTKVTGILPLKNGGTNANLAASASNGGIVWSNATQMQILGGTATANKMLLSGATATPAWSTYTMPVSFGGGGEIMYSSSATTIANLAAGTTGMYLRSNGTSAPGWQKIDLSSPGEINNTLRVFNGGTGLTTFGGNNTVLYTSAADILTAVPTSTGAGQFLQTAAIGGAPTWKSVLDVVNGGTGQSSPLIPGGILYGSTATAAGITAAGSAGQMLRSTGAGIPIWSSPTYPNSATLGKVMRGDGTNWLETTTTYPNATTINQLLYSPSANTISGLPTLNNGVLVTDGSGVPAWANKSIFSSSSLTDGHIYVGNVSNVATDVAMSGDATIVNSGAVTVGRINGALLGTTTVADKNILVSNATSWNSVPMTGDATIGNDGAVNVGRINGALLGTTTVADKNILVSNATSWNSVALGGDATISNTGSLTLANTAVTPGSYGDATHVGNYTVDSKGRLTFAGSTLISGTLPGGSAGGDLSGSYPDPTVSRINGALLGTTTVADKNILVSNATSWNSVPMTGDATIGNTGAVNVGRINGSLLGATTLTDKNILVSNGTSWNSVPMTGDATIGNDGAVNVGRINGALLGTTTVADKNILVSNATSWNSVALGGDATISNTGSLTLANTAVTPGSYGDATHVGNYTVDSKGRLTFAGSTLISGTLPGGSAGGDLSGSYPDPTVSRINGALLGTTTVADKNILVSNATSWNSVALGGDATISNTGSLTLANTAVTPGSYGDATHVGNYTVDSKGRLTFAGSTLISGTLPGGSAGGDLSGSYPDPTVSRINGALLGTTTVADKNILVSNATSWNSVPMTGDATIGNTGAVNVGRINGSLLGATTLTDRNILVSNGTSWNSVPMTGDATIGNDGAVNVGRINGALLGTTTVADKNILVSNATSWNSVALGGDATISNTGSLTLANTAVTPGSYGDATHVGNYTVDSKGRLTFAGSTLISGTLPGGSAGGDLSGSYPDPTVSRINGALLGTTTVADKNILVSNATSWNSVPMTGDATIGNGGAVNVGRINGALLGTTTVADKNILVSNATSWNSVALGGDATISNTGSLTLANTAVTPGSYGDATHVGNYTVDSKGRLTFAGSTLISGTLPGGSAGGDLSGSYPDPTVSRINGALLGTTTVADKNILVSNATSWNSVPMTGDATIGNTGAVNVGRINGSLLGATTLTDRNILVSNGTSWNSVPMTGDATIGNDGAVNVGRINGALLGTTTVADKNILVSNATSWNSVALGGDATISNTGSLTLANTAVTPGSYGDATHVGNYTVDSKGRLTFAGSTLISGTLPGGSAGGDLSGSYPDPTVSRINGALLGTTTVADKNILVSNATSWNSVPMTGDATIGNGGAVNVGRINGALLGTTTVADKNILVSNATSWNSVALGGDATISNTGSLTLANTAVTPGSYGDATHVGNYTVDSKGRLTFAGSTLISGTLPGGAAGGDLSGNYPNPTVAKINGATLGTTAATNKHILVANGTQWNSVAMSGDLDIDNLGATTVTSVGGSTAANVNAATVLANASTDLNTANTIVRRDASGNFTAGNITATLLGNATTATSATTAGSATNFTGALVGDVTGTQGATVVSTVGGSTAANVNSATVLANASTDANTVSTIVRRDASGNFSAGTITANLNGNASTVTTNANLTGDVTSVGNATTLSNTAVTAGSYGNSTQVGTFTVDGKGRLTAAASVTITGAAPTGLAGGDLSGNYPNPTVAKINGATLGTTAATNKHILVANGTQWNSVAMSGDLDIDNLGATTVTSVGGSTAANINTAEILANASTNMNTASAIVRRDASGNFAAGNITATLLGNATTATSATTAGSATNFTGALVGDVTGTQGATVVSTVGGSTAANVNSATVLANASTDANTVSTIVRRDASGNFSAGTITANLNGNASTVTTNANLTGDVTSVGNATTLSNTAVTAGSYGSSTQVGTFTVDGKGRLTAAGNTTITGTAPGGSAGGDLSGNYPNPTVAKINGATLGTTAATNKHILVANGTQWNSVAMSGDLDIDNLGATTVTSVGGSTAANINTAEILANASTNMNTASAIVRRDASGNFTAGNITATLLGNATTATSATTAGSATNFTGALVGDVTGTQGATVVSTVGGSTAANVNSATVLANASTDANTVSTIVRRDASGNFSAGTITANLNGNASTVTTNANLTGDVTSVGNATTLSNTAVTAGSYGSSTQVGTFTVDGKGRLTAAGNTTITGTAPGGAAGGDLSGNYPNPTVAKINGATLGTTAATNKHILVANGTQWNSVAMSGDLDIDNLGATTVTSVGGSTAANINTAEILANASTDLNTASAIVRRDASGNFTAGNITATLLGNATTATSATTAGSATNFTGALAGDVTGTQAATVVANVGGVTAANVASGSTLANAATNANTNNAIVRRDATGNFSATNITANLLGNATTATTAGSATNFSGALAGDVTGTQAATVVANVGGVTAANVASGSTLANAATNANTNNAIVRRDATGNFSATNITANLLGNATTATTAGSATNFSGALAGDVTGTQAATVVANVGGVTAANVATGANLANAATNANTNNAIVRRDATGNFSATNITANLLGNATTATTSTSFSGALAGDVTGTQAATVVANVGGVTAANVASGANLANAATNANTNNAIVRRDATGNFSATNITANLLGNATTATTAGNVTGTVAILNGGTGQTTQQAAMTALAGGVTAGQYLRGNGTNVLMSAIQATDIPNIAESQVTGLVADLASKQATGNYITALTGDATASGPGSAALTLATVNSNTGPLGSSTAIPTITTNAKGLVTAVTTNAVIAPAGTLTGATLAANVLSSSLTSVGTLGSLGVTGALTAGGAITGNTIVKTGGLANQFLKADGTTDANTYLTANQSISFAPTGDVTGSASGTTSLTPALVIANKAVTLAKMNDMASASLIYRKTAGIGAPEVQTLATLKTDLGLTGTNSGDLTLAAIGSSPNANGASVSAAQVLTLQPADATNGGVLTAGAQTVAGAKTWSNLGTFNAGLTSTGGDVNINVSSPFNTNINMGNSTGSVTIGNSSNSQNISIGIGSAVATVNIANSAAAHVVDIGSTTGAASTTIKSGTGGLNFITGAATNVTTTLGTSGSQVFASSTPNSDKIAIQPQSGVNTAAYTGTITTSDLTGARTYTFPDASGIVALVGSAASWSILGNTGTDPTINFIGTSDNKDMVYKANNIERLRIASSTADSSYITYGNTTTLASTIKTRGELTLREDGDQFGTSILRLRNRNGENGAIFETKPTLPTTSLVDFIFKTSINATTAIQRNIRFEARGSGTSRAGSPSFHIGGATGLGVADPDNPTLAIGDNYSIFKNPVKVGDNTYTAPTALLHLAAGTAAANTAPLKFTSGTLLSTTEAGAIEFNNDSYYATITTGAGTNPARKTFAFLQSPTFTNSLSLTGSTSGTITIQPQTVAGTYNFNLPIGAGTNGQPLLSGGGGGNAMTFGTLGVGAGGTGQTTFTNGQLLIGNTTGNTLTPATLTGGNGITITNGAGSIAIAYEPTITQIASTTTLSTNSTTDVALGTPMINTPAAGDYLVSFTAVVSNNTSGIGVIMSIYRNGTRIAASQIQATSGVATDKNTIATQAYLTGLSGSEAIEIRWRAEANTASITNRTLIIQKVK